MVLVCECGRASHVAGSLLNSPGLDTPKSNAVRTSTIPGPPGMASADSPLGRSQLPLFLYIVQEFRLHRHIVDFATQFFEGETVAHFIHSFSLHSPHRTGDGRAVILISFFIRTSPCLLRFLSFQPAIPEFPSPPYLATRQHSSRMCKSSSSTPSLPHFLPLHQRT